jgi:hypothetical protein
MAVDMGWRKKKEGWGGVGGGGFYLVDHKWSNSVEKPFDLLGCLQDGRRLNECLDPCHCDFLAQVVREEGEQRCVVLQLQRSHNRPCKRHRMYCYSDGGGERTWGKES